MIWALLIIVGASSAYFHATLSLLGQVSILLNHRRLDIFGVKQIFPQHPQPQVKYVSAFLVVFLVSSKQVGVKLFMPHSAFLVN